jgi:hypothetical protein
MATPGTHARGERPDTVNRVTSREFPLDWNDLTEARRLRDGDVVECTIEDIGDSSRIEFTLSLAPYKSWWKQLELCADDDSRIAAVEVVDNRKGPAVMNIDAAFVRRGGRLYLWKAKEFGIHRRIYVLPDVWAHAAGKRVNILWTAD